MGLYAYSWWLWSLLSRLTLITILAALLRAIDDLFSELVFHNLSRKYQMADHPLFVIFSYTLFIILPSLSVFFQCFSVLIVHLQSIFSISCLSALSKYRFDHVILLFKPFKPPVVGSTPNLKLAPEALCTSLASLTSLFPIHSLLRLSTNSGCWLCAHEWNLQTLPFPLCLPTSHITLFGQVFAGFSYLSLLSRPPRKACLMFHVLVGFLYYVLLSLPFYKVIMIHKHLWPPLSGISITKALFD